MGCISVWIVSTATVFSLLSVLCPFPPPQWAFYSSNLIISLVITVYFWIRSTHLFSLTPSPHLHPYPPPLFPPTFQSDPHLAQAWPITVHLNQGAGWKRWPASEGQPMRYRFEWQTSAPANDRKKSVPLDRFPFSYSEGLQDGCSLKCTHTMVNMESDSGIEVCWLTGISITFLSL